MQIQSLNDRLNKASLDVRIIADHNQGFTKVSPDVIMFYGVTLTPLLTKKGIARQKRFIAIIDKHIIIEPYEH